MRTLLVLVLLASWASAQDRDAKVRDDKKAHEASKDWIYGDLAEAQRAAKLSGKPMLVVFRCIPCEACQEFDDDVARRDPAIRDLLDKFVCVRIVQANAMDLARFQHDFDLSFAAYLTDADLTIYGRFGTRSERSEEEDISLAGLRAAMEFALRIHRDGGELKAALADKQVEPGPYKTPRDYPSLAGKYEAKLNYEGQVAKSCIHCHQVREAERLVHRDKGTIPDASLFPHPDPSVLGLKMDPRAAAKVERVEPSSIAAKAGVKVGDDIESLAGQPPLSIADLQWVLHNTADAATLKVRIRRAGKVEDVSLELPKGWRRGDISWRATTWDLRRMALGGLKLEELSPERRAEAGLKAGDMALRVEHVGEYGDHAAAKKAGILRDDIIIAFDGSSGKMSETDLIAHAVQGKKPGDEVEVTVLRGGERRTMRFALK